MRDGYYLCSCKTFLLIPDSTDGTKKKSLQKGVVHYLQYLKLLLKNNIVAQRKTTYIEKQYFANLTQKLLCIANTCKWQTFTAQTVYI